jgi:CheY-like chemotaxis protein
VLEELRSNPETSAIPVMVVTGDSDLSDGERDLLDSVRVLQKSDISQEVYDAFISGVQNQLAGRRA